MNRTLATIVCTAAILSVSAVGCSDDAGTTGPTTGDRIERLSVRAEVSGLTFELAPLLEAVPGEPLPDGSLPVTLANNSISTIVMDVEGERMILEPGASADIVTDDPEDLMISSEGVTLSLVILE